MYRVTGKGGCQAIARELNKKMIFAHSVSATSCWIHQSCSQQVRLLGTCTSGKSHKCWRGESTGTHHSSRAQTAQTLQRPCKTPNWNRKGAHVLCMLSHKEKLTFLSVQCAHVKIPLKIWKKSILDKSIYSFEMLYCRSHQNTNQSPSALWQMLHKWWLTANQPLSFPEQSSFLKHLQSLFLEEHFPN